MYLRSSKNDFVKKITQSLAGIDEVIKASSEPCIPQNKVNQKCFIEE